MDENARVKKPVRRTSSWVGTGGKVFLRTAFLLQACLSFLPAQEDSWLHPSWNVRRVASNLSPVGGLPLTNFTVLLRLTNDDFARACVAGNAGDLTFVGEDGIQLFHEVESFDRNEGILAAWVCLPRFTNRTRFWMYASNTSGRFSFLGSNADEGLQGTFADLNHPAISTRAWDSNYLVVMHYSNQTAQVLVDSTRWSNNASNVTAGAFLAKSNGVAGLGWYGSIAGGSGSCVSIASNVLARHAPQFRYRGSTISSWHRGLSDPSTQRPNVPNVSVSNNQAVLFNWRSEFSLGGQTRGAVYWSSAEPSALSGIVNGRSSKAMLMTPLDQWNFYCVSGGVTMTSILPLPTRLIRNDSVVAINESSTAAAYSVFQELNVIGGPSSAAPNYRFHPVGWYDEFRVSTVERSPEWLFSEYSNVIQATNGGAFVLGDLTPRLLARVGNLNAGIPLPTAGSPTTNGLLPESVYVVQRGPNYISNIVWEARKVSTGEVIGPVVSNYSSDQSRYLWPVTFPVSGTWQLIARVVDLSNSVLTASNFFTVYENGYVHSPTNAVIRRSAAGIQLDLFGRPSRISSFTLGTLRNGQPWDLSDLGSGVFLDTNDLYYGKEYAYTGTVTYAESGLRHEFDLRGSFEEPSPEIQTLSLSGGVEERTFRTWDSSVTFPSGMTGEMTVVSEIPERELHGTGTAGRVFRQRLYYRRGGPLPSSFGGMAKLQIRLGRSNGTVTSPGFPEFKLSSEEMTRFTLVEWDGRDWNPVPTIVTPYASMLVLTALIDHGGRFGIGFPPGNRVSSRGEGATVNSRLLIPGSADPVRNVFSVRFENPDYGSTRFLVLDMAGRIVHEETARTGVFHWGGNTAWGDRASPGMYVWRVKVSGKDVSTHQGTLVIMRRD